MAKKEGSEEKVEGNTTESPDNTTETPDTGTLPLEPEPKTYTQEEVDAQLKEQYDKINARLSEKGARIRELEQKVVPKVSTSGTAQALQEMIGAIEAQAREVGGEISSATQVKLNAARQQLAMVERDAVFEKQEVVTNQVIVDLRSKCEDAGEDPDDPKFDSVWDAIQIAKLSDGNFDRAKSRTDRILKQVKPPEDKKGAEPKEPELTDEQTERVVRKWKDKHGELQTHEGAPSGASGSDDEFIKKFSTAEKNSPEDIKRAQKILSNL